MLISRRALLAATTVIAVAPALAVTPVAPVTVTLRAPGRRDYTQAIEAIRLCAQAQLAANGLPGMIVSLVADDGFEAELALGWADLTSRTPVNADHLFEIGSISKSLVALALWQLAGEGKIDLNAPVRTYLPLACLPPEPITAQQLLNHVAGLPDNAPIPPDVPGGGLWTGAKPGTNFSYSNTGYELIGLLVTAVAGRPHPDVIRDRVLRPIGMDRATAHITVEERSRLATGYVPADDLPPMFGIPLVEGPWSEMDMAAGSITATAADMAAYLRYVMMLGRGRGAPLLSDAGAKAMLANMAKAEALGGGYSSGFMRTRIDGRPILHHTGGMEIFTSSFDVDAEEGVGAFASQNGTLGEHRPTEVTAYAVRALRAVRLGKPVPPQPNLFALAQVAQPDRYVGRWVGSDGTVLDIDIAAGALLLHTGAHSGQLQPLGGYLMTDTPGFRADPLEFSHVDGGKDKTAPFDLLWYRDRAFGRGKAPAAANPTPPSLRALAGNYRSPNSWASADLVARGGQLVSLGGGPLVQEAAGYWRAVEDKGGYERFWFDTPVGSRPYRLSLSGNSLRRLS